MTPPRRHRSDGRDEEEEETPLVVSNQFLLDLAKWVAEAPRIAARVLQLMLEIARDPREGIGKPKPLKHALGGYWSRRITDEHRLVYRMRNNRIEFARARDHYT